FKCTDVVALHRFIHKSRRTREKLRRAGRRRAARKSVTWVERREVLPHRWFPGKHTGERALVGRRVEDEERTGFFSRVYDADAAAVAYVAHQNAWRRECECFKEFRAA